MDDVQRIARIGSWTRDAEADKGTWTSGMYTLLERDPALGPANRAELLARIHPDDRDHFAAAYGTTLNGGPSFELDYRIVLDGGGTRTLHGIGRQDAGRPGFYVGTVQDVTELREVDRELRNERDYAAAITGSMHEGFMLTLDGTILEVNPALCELTGFTRGELLGSRVPYPFWAPEAVEEILRQRGLIDERGYDFEATYLHKDGTRFDAAISSVAARTAEGHLLGYVSTVRDVSERKRHLVELERLATHDPLTGLANHRAFHERLREEVARASRNFQALSLALLDLDEFKGINDRHGHAVGDSVLRELGERLSSITRRGELIARVGGEEFAWILNVQGPAAFAAAERARRVIARTPFSQAGTVTISIGVCDLTVADDAGEIYDYADQSLYLAKGQGRNRTCQSVRGLMPSGRRESSPSLPAHPPAGVGR